MNFEKDFLNFITNIASECLNKVNEYNNTQKILSSQENGNLNYACLNKYLIGYNNMALKNNSILDLLKTKNKKKIEEVDDEEENRINKRMKVENENDNKKRILFTEDEKKRMNDYYNEKKTNKLYINELSSELNIPYKKIKTYFSNKKRNSKSKDNNNIVYENKTNYNDENIQDNVSVGNNTDCSGDENKSNELCNTPIIDSEEINNFNFTDLN